MTLVGDGKIRIMPLNTCKIKRDFDLSPRSVTTVSQFLFFGSKGVPLFRVQPLVAIGVEIVGFVIDNSSSVFTVSKEQHHQLYFKYERYSISQTLSHRIPKAFLCEPWLL
jgi:hypothetical protein